MAWGMLPLDLGGLGVPPMAWGMMPLGRGDLRVPSLGLGPLRVLAMAQGGRVLHLLVSGVLS